MIANEDFAGVHIRKLPIWVIKTYEHTATQQKQSLEGYLRSLLTNLALEKQHRFLDRAAVLQEQVAKTMNGHHPDTTQLINEDREGRLL